MEPELITGLFILAAYYIGVGLSMTTLMNILSPVLLWPVLTILAIIMIIGAIPEAISVAALKLNNKLKGRRNG